MGNALSVAITELDFRTSHTTVTHCVLVHNVTTCKSMDSRSRPNRKPAVPVPSIKANNARKQAPVPGPTPDSKKLVRNANDGKKAQNRGNSPAKSESSWSSSSGSIDSVELEEQFGDRRDNRCLKICKENWPCNRISFPTPANRKEHVFWGALVLELFIVILGLVTVIFYLKLVYLDLSWNEHVQFDGPFGLHESEYEICFGGRSWLTNNWKLYFLRRLVSLNIALCLTVVGFCSQFGHVLLVFLVKGLYGVYHENQHTVVYALAFVFFAVQSGLMKSIISERQAEYAEVVTLMTGCVKLHGNDSAGWKHVSNGSNKKYAAFQGCAKEKLSSTDADAREPCFGWHNLILNICLTQLTLSLLLVIVVGLDIYCDWKKRRSQVEQEVASNAPSLVHPVDDGKFVFEESKTRVPVPAR